MRLLIFFALSLTTGGGGGGGGGGGDDDDGAPLLEVVLLAEHLRNDDSGAKSFLLETSTSCRCPATTSPPPTVDLRPEPESSWSREPLEPLLRVHEAPRQQPCT